MKTDDIKKGQVLLLTTNKYGLRDSMILVTVKKVVDWQNIYCEYFCSHTKMFETKAFNATHLEPPTMTDCINEYNHYRRIALDFRSQAEVLGYVPKTAPKNATDNPKQNKSRKNTEKHNEEQ